jgi:CheY-like chemotaxis protein
MPDLDGFELARMIRNHPRFQQTAIIFVSALFAWCNIAANGALAMSVSGLEQTSHASSCSCSTVWHTRRQS